MGCRASRVIERSRLRDLDAFSIELFPVKLLRGIPWSLSKVWYLGRIRWLLEARRIFEGLDR